MSNPHRTRVSAADRGHRGHNTMWPKWMTTRESAGAVECVRCLAGPGEPCFDRYGQGQHSFHKQRHELAVELGAVSLVERRLNERLEWLRDQALLDAELHSG